MNKMLKDFREGKITYGDFTDPEVLAKYALTDPTDHKELLDNFKIITMDILNLDIGLDRDDLIYMAGIYKEALDIVDVNLHVRGELP